jgi:hypothetical protein
MYPQMDLESIGYYPSAYPLPNPPAGYPPIYLHQAGEYEAVMELRTSLRNTFPDDTVLVLVPPSMQLNRRTGRTLACR